MKTISFPFVKSSSKNDYACADGELAQAHNVIIGATGGASSTSDGLPFKVNRVISVPIEAMDGNIGLTDPGSRDYGWNGSEMANGNDGSIESGEGYAVAGVKVWLEDTILPGWHTAPERPLSQVVEQNPKAPTESGWGARSMEMLASIHAQAARESLLTEPVLVCTALRHADGSLSGVSPPWLMWPNDSVPIVEGTDDFSVADMLMSVRMSVCRLFVSLGGEPVSVVHSSPVVAWEVMVSSPLALYDRKTPPVGYHRLHLDGHTYLQAWMPVANPEWTLPSALEAAGGSRQPEESGSADAIPYILTRPLKLGNAERKKRVTALTVRCIFPQGRGDPSELLTTLYGSNDLDTWHPMASAHSLRLHGLWTPPCRFFRLEVRFPKTCSPQGVAVTAM